MILNYSDENEDLKFLFFYYNKNITLQRNSSLSLISDIQINEEDEIIKELFSLAKEDFTKKSLTDFKKFQKNPTPSFKTVTVISLINYINLLKTTLSSGSLKYKDYIAEFTSLIKDNIPFDPEFYYFELRGGLIKNIFPAPEMDKLFCEEVCSNKDYFICSGLRSVYKEEDLINKVFLFLLNIKKVKFKQLYSEGMICCVEDTENSKVEAIELTSDKGSRVHLHGGICMFENLEYGKVDFSKTTYKSLFSNFKIIDNHLTFKGIKLTYNGEFIKTRVMNGDVR